MENRRLNGFFAFRSKKGFIDIKSDYEYKSDSVKKGIAKQCLFIIFKVYSVGSVTVTFKFSIEPILLNKTSEQRTPIVL